MLCCLLHGQTAKYFNPSARFNGMNPISHPYQVPHAVHMCKRLVFTLPLVCSPDNHQLLTGVAYSGALGLI